ncbi:MAG: phytoene desaturase [Myxococcales bacterium]|nr:phytoene desaturase [Myxococcales bacterium]
MSDARTHRAAVIGSGFGGLAAAIRLQTAGVATTIYEARDLPGGRAYVYKDDGFTFDAGPTVITAPHCLEELWTEAGRTMADDVELLPVTPFYRLHWLDDGHELDYDGELDSMKRQIAARSPDDVDGYERFAAYSRKVFDQGYTKLAATPFLRFWDMVKVAPQLGRLRADRSVYATVAKYIKDEHIRQALSFHSLLVGGNPFETSSIYTLIHHLERTWGVWFARGGTGALVQAMVKLFTSLGGELRLNAPVERVTVDAEGKHHVAGAGAAERFDLVVSNADLDATYTKLYGEEPRAKPMQQKLARSDWSMSLFVLYFGTDRTYADRVAHHTVVFGKRYKELLAEIFHGAELPDDMSLYLHAPHLTDPSVAPAGHGAFYVLSPVPHLGNAALDWDALGADYADRVLATLEPLLPDVRKHVVTKRWITPFTFRDELAAKHGAAFSVAPKLTQSAYFRPHNKCDHIPNLYIVGAGTHPGAGVPGVVNSAKATMSLIARDLGLTVPETTPMTVPGTLAEAT